MLSSLSNSSLDFISPCCPKLGIILLALKHNLSAVLYTEVCHYQHSRPSHQHLCLLLVHLCQQIRIYVHLRQDLFQHLCRAGVFYTWGKSSWERLPGLPPLGWHGGAPTDLPRCSWGWDDGSSANWLWVPTPGSLSKTPLMNLQRATAKMQPC